MESILLVDADLIARSAMASILQAQEYQVKETGTLAEARELVLQEEFALVITEYNLADCQGSQIVESFKKLFPQLEILVVTSQGSLEAAIACMRAGAGDFLLKPIIMESFCEAVRKLVQKKALSQENTMLKIVNEMKDKFLSLASHELRTPLTLVYGYLSILFRQRAALTPQQAGLLDIVINSTRQLIDIVNNLQIITQVEANEMKLHFQPIQPRKLLTDVVAEMQASITQRNLNLRMEKGENLDVFYGDSIRLRHVLMELIQNSIRNTPDGGTITIGGQEEAGYLVLWVQDNGVGIPEEEQGKVFQTFYGVADVQQHSSHGSRFGSSGMGIGLSLVKAVAVAHHGKIYLKSAVGQGTRVEMHLPYQKVMPDEGIANEFSKAKFQKLFSSTPSHQ